jgi:secondary thiamine-phosphate synthase enzyme
MPITKEDTKPAQFKIHTAEFAISTRGETDILNITDAVEKSVKESGVQNGQVLIFCPGSTVGITTVEYEPGLVKDIKAVFEKIAPRNARYHHEDTWHDGNGYAHVRASLLGQNQVFPVKNGKLYRGAWQQIVLVDFDNRPRERTVALHVSGQ